MAALQEKKSCSQRMEEFQHYCWNPDTGQMLGRTLSRWGPCGRAGAPGEGRGPASSRVGLAVSVPRRRPWLASPPPLGDPKGPPQP